MSSESSNKITQDKLDKIVQILEDNGVVILPTDTVYGLFTRAFDQTTFERMEKIKRDRSTPYSVTFNNTNDMFGWYGTVDLVRRNIIGDLTPGPVTVVLPYNDKIPDNYRYPDHGIGLRVSSNQVLNQVMDKLDFPLWSTSANRAGDGAPVRYADVNPALLKFVDTGIDDGETDYLKSSDVLDLRNRPFSLLREGPWQQKINKILSLSKKAFHIVVVCTGNLCRSPIAEVLIRKKLESIQNANVIVESAGVYAVDGYPATEEMVSQADRFDLDLSGHKAKQLTPDMIARAGLILSVSTQHSNTIVSSHPQASQKIRLLGEKIDLEEIVDPYQRGEAAYVKAANDIDNAVNSWTEEFISAFSDTKTI